MSPSIRRRVHSEPTLEYAFYTDTGNTPMNGDRQTPFPCPTLLLRCALSLCISDPHTRLL